MRVSVLGTGPAFPNKGGATSGYLVAQDGTSLLIDCGTGVVSNLQRHADYHQITAIVITHMHADHFLDIIPYRYGLKHAIYHKQWQHPLLYLPPGGTAILRHMVEPLADSRDFFGDVFSLAEYDPAASLRIGNLDLRFAATRHPIPAFAVAVQGNGKTVVFSADTAPDEAVVGLARHADLFFCEAGIQNRDQDAPTGAHLTPTEAGETAAKAGVKKLLLTHLWQEFDKNQVIREASEAFGAPVQIAEENVTYQV